MVDESLYAYMRSQLELTSSDFHRYLYDDINWNARMVAITGARGVGQINHGLAISEKQDIRQQSPIHIGRTHIFQHT